MAAFRRLVRDLSYTHHGGSGYGHGYRDILEMDGADAMKAIEHLDALREAEAAAIKNANRTPAR